MVATRIEFASDVEGSTCPECLRDTAREAVLVNSYGLVLARGTTCGHCGHQRHRLTAAQHDVRRRVVGARIPRVA